MGSSKFFLFDKILKNGHYNDFLEYAKFMYSIKRFAVFNSAMVISQRPGAEYVDTESNWEKRFGRKIKPGAIPIVIMQPFGPINFVYEARDTLGDNDITLFHFDDDVITGYPWDRNVYDKLVRTVNQLGIWYNEVNFGGRLYGQACILDEPVMYVVEKAKKKYSFRTDICIQVNEGQSAPIKAATILHELGHILCGHFQYDRVKNVLSVPRREAKLTHEQMEIEAEKVSEIASEMLGFYYDSSIYLRRNYPESDQLNFSLRVVVDAVDKILKSFSEVEMKYGNTNI